MVPCLLLPVACLLLPMAYLLLPRACQTASTLQTEPACTRARTALRCS